MTAELGGDFERKKNEQRPLATQKQRHEMRNVHVVGCDGLGMNAKHCDTCQHKTVEEAILTGGQWKTCVLTCAIGHKPRFFKPRYIHDYEWGWKRKCEDYKNAD